MYLFYVDESGNLDVKCHPDHWLYTLTAVGIFEHNWKKFYLPLVEKKRQLIETIRQNTNRLLSLHECEVKSTWCRIPKQRKAKSFFLDQLSDAERTELADLYYSQIERVNGVCISVAIDKRELHSYMDRGKLHSKAWELLCERIENYMRECHPKHCAVIIVDDVSPQTNAALAGKHAYFLEKYTTAGLSIRQILEMPLFVRSELSEGVQLADLCAYNVYRSIAYTNPEYPFFKRLLPLYYNSCNTASGKLDGMKIFPDTSKHLQDWITLLQK